MTVEEAFKTLASHMVEGMMIHDYLSNAFAFLNLEGYQQLSEYRFIAESKGYRKLNRFYTEHFNKLIESDRVEDPALIPASWYVYTKQQVDTNTKRNAVKNLIDSWVNWETDTKKLYQDMSHELADIGEISASLYVDDLVKDVSEELRKALNLSIDLASMDYDMRYILDTQEALHSKYKDL